MNEMVAFINLFFVPVLPVYAYYKRSGKQLGFSLEILMEYCIVAAVLIPLTKIVLFLPAKILHTQVYIYSGYYTLAALFLAALPLFINILRKSSVAWHRVGALSHRAKFLLKHQTEADWSWKKRGAYYTYRVLLIAFTAFLMGILLLDVAAGDIIGLKDYLFSWKLLVLNTAPIALLAILLYGVTGRAWSGLLVGGGLTTVLSLANYYKLNFRKDPLRIMNGFIAAMR